MALIRKFHLFLVFGVVLSAGVVVGTRYKCFKDICDSTWQFCNEEEKRCSACTHQECSGEGGEVKYDQCQEVCQGLEETSTVTSTPHKVSPGNLVLRAIKEVKSVEMVRNYLLSGGLAVLIVVIVCIAVIVYKIHKSLKTLRIHGNMIKSPSVIDIGDVEKQPLIMSSQNMTDLQKNCLPVVQETSAIGQDPDSQMSMPSAPPSYMTSDHSQRPASSSSDETPSGVSDNPEGYKTNHQSQGDFELLAEDNRARNLWSSKNLGVEEAEATSRKMADD